MDALPTVPQQRSFGLGLSYCGVNPESVPNDKFKKPAHWIFRRIAGAPHAKTRSKYQFAPKPVESFQKRIGLGFKESD